ncbi:alpha/beta fold hydrolase [Altererythrobacter sp.]|uniref:alpha/beta hydrolase family protein n=1 Tax=Altererythrobacter sp. TaxID=1872480 RepID=UPI001B1384E6|nr:alpha/beta fold hydrolase [Altererythrobacter sp.]MBO6609914.1 S9 family peptidase [Altererythrobacter sp.]MBO6641678.1 S9 family peptidase [Altererythrobacter sp.]MBO6707623.1 S9 family peptidase [Altererythrobacter sp.]MBO6946245.1 S9 family peptidase [Altererythrobacter sp.]
MPRINLQSLATARSVFATMLFGAGLVAPVPIAAQIQVPPLEFYGELPAVEDAVVSPSGAYTALLQTARGERVITVIDSAGNPVKQLVVGDARVRGIEWVGEEAILLLRTETDRTTRRFGNEKVEWWRGNVIPLDDRRDVVSIFANQRYVANAIVGFYGIRNVDGRWKGYFGGFRKGRASGERARILDFAPALYAVDLLSGEVDLVAYAPDYPTLRRWLVNAEGKVGATLEIDEQNGDWRIENAEGKTIAKGDQPRGEVSLTGFGADGRSIIYRYYDDAVEQNKRMQVSADGSTTTELWTDVQISEFVRDKSSGVVMGILTTDAKYQLAEKAKQARMQEALNVALGRKGIGVEVEGFSSDMRAIVVSTSGNYDSGTWLRVNPDNDSRSILALERPAIQGPVIGQVSEFSYQAQDGLDMQGILTLPPGIQPENLPVVILPHGGPNAHDDLEFDWWAQAFASRGYAVFQPNFRGSTGRGEDFVNAGDGEWGRKMQTDKSDGLRALAKAGIVDAGRACIVGASYGGYAAVAGVTIEQDVYRCAVAVNGVFDLKRLLDWRITGRRDIFRRAADRQFGKETDLDAISPTKLAQRADAPIMLIHGRDDTVVPYEQSLFMKDALEDADKPVAMISLDGEDHYLSQPDTRKAMLNAAVGFVERHNPPV